MLINEKSLNVYCDASYYKDYKQGIIAFIVFDQEGNQLRQKNKKITCTSSNQAELQAILYATKWINFYQRANLIRNRININIFGDCKSVINVINQNKITDNNLKSVPTNDKMNLNQEIKKLYENNKVVVRWKSRKGNKQADNLTKPRCLFVM